jgi:tetratricopeptide (TPR) repeat protein/O-antigen ligase
MRERRRSGLLAFVVILYFTFIGGSFYSDLNFPLRVFNQIVVTALLGGWLVGKVRRREPLPRTGLDGPVLAWVAAHLVASILGLSPRFSLEKAWTVVTHAMAFYLATDLRRHRRTGTVARALYLSAGGVCVVGLVEMAGWYFGVPPLSRSAQSWLAIGGLRQPLPPILHRLSFTLTGATPLSAYLALLIPPALAMVATASGRDDRQAMAAWLVPAAIVEAASFSRGGVLALLVSLPLTGLGWLLARPGRATALWEALRSHRAALVAGLAAATLLAVLVGPAWLAHTFANRGFSTNFRFTLWGVAWRAFLEHPWSGVGTGNFGRSLLLRNDPTLPRAQIMTAHNLYLNTAAELGLLGLAAGTWLAVAAVRAWVSRWRSAPQPRERVLVAAAGSALVGLAAQSAVDTFTATPNVLPVLLLAAYALTESSPHPPDHEPRPARRGRPLLPTLALAALLVYAPGLAWWGAAQFAFERSVDLASQGDLAEAAEAARLAGELDPALSLYAFQQAYLRGQMSDQPAELAEAVQLYRRGLAAEPVGGRQQANLAAVLWLTGDRSAAIEALEQAAAAEPDPLVWVNLGYFCEQVGDGASAVQAYGRALALAPQLAGSEYWAAAEDRAAQWTAILDQARTALAPGVDPVYWQVQVALAQQDWLAASTHAQSLLDTGPESCELVSALARAWYGLGRFDTAEELAESALGRERDCGPAYLVRGMVRSTLGNPSGAEADWHTALFLGEREAAYHLGQMCQRQGDTESAAGFYLLALAPSPMRMDVEVTLYDRRASFDLLPPLFRIGMSAADAAPWLELGRLRELEGEVDAARRIYVALSREDPYLAAAQERIDALPVGQ